MFTSVQIAVSAYLVESIDTTGAGDAFMAEIIGGHLTIWASQRKRGLMRSSRKLRLWCISDN